MKVLEEIKKLDEELEIVLRMLNLENLIQLYENPKFGERTKIFIGELIKEKGGKI